MTSTGTVKKKRGRPKSRTGPAGYKRIVEALKSLLEEKSFQEITWGEIARNAGVSEALIYQYFKTRHGLLYSVLAEFLKEYKARIYISMEGSQGTLEKVKAFIGGLLALYNDNRVFARIILLEVRNFPDYYESEAYALTRDFGQKYLTILQEGIESGEIRRDTPASRMRQVLLGGVEHAVLPYIIFQKEADTEAITREITPLLLDAIRNRDNAS
ncbi:MAG: TetR/AcrR family transcriptional regulator [Pseudomonadota bacterium]